MLQVNFIFFLLLFSANGFPANKDNTQIDSYLVYTHASPDLSKAPQKSIIGVISTNTSSYENLNEINRTSTSFYNKYAVKSGLEHFVVFNTTNTKGSKLTFFPLDGLNQDTHASQKLTPLLTIFKLEF
jgi:hypothetical protein